MMKTTFFLCALALIGSINGQDNPLTECQYITQTYHLMFEGTASNIRTRMGEYMQDVNGALMSLMVEEMQRWEQMTQRCGGVLTPWQRNTEAIGEAVRQCAERKAVQLVDLQSNIFNVLEDIHVLSNELALMPVAQLVDINIVTDNESFVQRCETFVVDHYNEFEDVHVVRLNDHINNLLDARDSLPQELTTCINAAMTKRFPHVHSC